MGIWESVKIALRALRINKMRTSLTMLGVVIGVGAVIAMVAIGEGAARSIRAQIESFGTNLLVVNAGNSRLRFDGSGTTGRVTSLMPSDAKAIEQRCRDSVALTASVCRGNADAKQGDKSSPGLQIVGATPAYDVVAKWSVEEGRFLNEQDENGRARVAVIGRTTIETLTGDRHTDIVGQSILINRVAFRVIGVLKEKGTGAFGFDQDDLAIIPCSTALHRVFNRKYLSEIDVSAATEADVSLATEQIASLMRERHKLRPPFPDDDDFTVRTLAQFMEAMGAVSGVMTTLLGGIASVSLIVGGIGIMNIMLVSVTERTREIGLRKSVGATSKNILTQFLIEAVVISVLGGAVGVLFGGGASVLIGKALSWKVAISPQTVGLAFGVASGVGLFFGIYPAKRAADLNPIDALRFE